MGEISDMIMNGILCERCGSYIDDEEPGFPRKCDKCMKDKEAFINSKGKVLTDDEVELLVDYLKSVATDGLKKDK